MKNHYGIIIPYKNQDEIITGFSEPSEDVYSCSEFNNNMETIPVNEYIAEYINSVEDKISTFASTLSWQFSEITKNDNVKIIGEGSPRPKYNFLTPISLFIKRFIAVSYSPEQRKAFGYVYDHENKGRSDKVKGYEKARGYDVVGELEEKYDINIKWDDFVGEVETSESIEKL